MKPKIFISAPMTVPMEHLYGVRNSLHNEYDIPNLHVSYWDRKSDYDQKEFDSADAVIFILDNWEFDSRKKGQVIPPGVHRELQEADKQTKEIFLAYLNRSSGEIKLYEVDFVLGRGNDFQDTSIKGIAGSSEEFGKFVKSWEKYYGEKETSKQDSLEKAAIRLEQNSTYGAFSELEHPDYNKTLDRWKKAGLLENTDPIEQAILPEARRVYAKMVPNPDFPDERLLFLL